VINLIITTFKIMISKSTHCFHRLISIPVHTGIEGGNITVQCSFYVFGKWKLVCKEECQENILIKTTKDAARRGRYFITYKAERFPTHHAFLYVSITQLQKSDSGLYRCYLDRRSDPYLYEGFQLNVIEGGFENAPSFVTSSISHAVLFLIVSLFAASTSSTTIKPTLALQSVSPPTITSSKQSEISTIDSGFLWPVVISVVLVVLVLSVGLIYKKKTVDSCEFHLFCTFMMNLK
uniref:Immunoglobulin domain-containing protein n=1 Tax=Amphilophus citrinellus TaxID=61819 RepID=A0A3Q0R5Y8_AMPCI